LVENRYDTAPQWGQWGVNFRGKRRQKEAIKRGYRKRGKRKGNIKKKKKRKKGEKKNLGVPIHWREGYAHFVTPVRNVNLFI